MHKVSLNNNVIVEPYTGNAEGLKAEIKMGLAVPKQKYGVVGLKLLIPAYIGGSLIKQNSVVYFNEEYLYVNPEAKKIKNSKLVESDFIVLEADKVIAIEEL